MYIQNKNTTKTVKWEGWPYLLDLLDIFQNENEIIILKARQLGISWLVVGFSLWKVLFHDNAKVLFFSQGEVEAWDLVAKARFIYKHLPDYMKRTLENDTRSWLTFAANDSEIKAMPSTDKAGRGTDTTIVIRDEVAQHQNAKENFAAIGPTLDSGGQSIDLSTIDKLDSSNHFTKRVNEAYHGAIRTDYPSGLTLFRKGKFEPVLVFAGWKLRPTRQEGLSLDEWFNLRIKPKYNAFTIEQEYPATIEEALRPTQERAFFDVIALDDMLMHILPPLTRGHTVPTYNGMVRVYKPPVVGEKYIIFTDPSDGVDDPFHTVVMHARTYEGVCEAYGKITADRCAEIHDSLVRGYNNAFNSYEVNANAGGKFAESIKNLETPSQAPRWDIQTGKVIPDKQGWWTSPQSKKIMLYGLEEAIRSHNIISHDRDTIQQFQAFIVPEGELPQKMRGCFDDAIMAWAGVWQLSKHLIPIGTAKFSSFQYRTS